MILNDNTSPSFKDRIRKLKADSKLYPDLIFRHFDSNIIDGYKGSIQLFISTLVRINRDGVWYTIHAAEWCIISPSNVDTNIVEVTVNRLLHAVVMIQLYYIPQPFDQPDIKQISEKDRLNPAPHLITSK